MIRVRSRDAGVSPFGVSARRLTNRTVQLCDASLENCVLVPFFDARGVTAKVAMLSARTRECWILDWRPGLIYVPWLRAIRVDMSRAASRRVATGEPLWLFDPSGLADLALASLCGGTVASNAAEVLPKTVVGLSWRRDLSRVSSVSLRKKGGGTELVRWKAQWLAEASPQSTTRTPLQKEAVLPVPSACDWVLDPIWMR